MSRIILPKTYQELDEILALYFEEAYSDLKEREKEMGYLCKYPMSKKDYYEVVFPYYLEEIHNIKIDWEARGEENPFE